MTQKQFWNIMYESRYEALMRNPKWPPLKVCTGIQNYRHNYRQMTLCQLSQLYVVPKRDRRNVHVLSLSI